jgi:hypothetical protein
VTVSVDRARRAFDADHSSKQQLGWSSADVGSDEPIPRL